MWGEFLSDSMSYIKLMAKILVGIGVSLSSHAAGEYVPGEIIIKLKPTGFKGSTKAFNSFADRMGMKLEGSWRSMDMHKYKMGADQDMEAVARSIEEDPSVEFAEPNYIFTKASLTSFSEVSSLGEMNGKFASGFSLTSANIEVENAWGNMSAGTNETVVAVIDTGLDMDHSSFSKLCALWVNEAEKNGTPGVDDDRNGYVDDVHGWNFVSNNNNPDDDDGHGTHVSGIVLGTGIDILTLPGGGNECSGPYQSKIKIMPLKFLDGNGAGSTSDAIEAIYYAVNNGAKILNNSWGGGSYSRSLHEAVIHSYNRKTLFVAASGNSGMNNDSSPMFPANYDVPNVVSVAATSSSDYKASFSNFGSTSVHLGSPGVAIYSSVPNNLYGTMSGTSMAAPFVAGVAAIISREHPNMYGYQIKDIINKQSDAISNLSSFTITGKRLNVNDTLTSAKASAVWTDQPVYNLSMSLYDRELASALASGGAGCGLVKSVFDNTKGGPKGPGSGSGLSRFLLLLGLCAPLALWAVIRRRSEDYNRTHERFKVDSKVKLQVGGREIEGNMGSISMGGAGINVDQLLEHGSVVTLKIQSPDGTGEIEVDGQVVWSDGGTEHGVQFASMAERVKSRIERWTSILGTVGSSS